MGGQRGWEECREEISVLRLRSRSLLDVGVITFPPTWPPPYLPISNTSYYHPSPLVVDNVVIELFFLGFLPFLKGGERS